MEETMSEEPLRDDSAREEPAREEPAREEPAREEPPIEEPPIEEPAREGSSREDPNRSSSAEGSGSLNGVAAAAFLLSSLKGLYVGLYCTLGAVMVSSGLNTGMSGRSCVSKSKVGTSLKMPTVSRTAAATMEKICCSSSNFISVFVGWMFTSMFSAGTSK